MPGKLYIVPTPVGNLDDMAPRAIATLQRCSVIYAEDTRTSATVMRHFGITTPMLSFHKFNEHGATESVVDRVEAGEEVALVSDAGTPGISDPGFMLTRECRRRDLLVECLPGPTAFVPALINSGLPCDRFCFEGFLPPKKGRASRLQEIADDLRTTVIYESPLRLQRTLEQLAEACGADRPASVSREISKIHDTTHRGTLGELADYFKANPARGEIVVILGGKPQPAAHRTHRNKYRSDVDAPDVKQE